MNKKKLHNKFTSENFREFSGKISDKTKPKLNEEERRLRTQIYAN